MILLLTKRRLNYAKLAVQSLKNLKTRESIHFHIADDGSGDDYVSELANIVEKTLGDVSITMTNSNDQGYGANYNLAMQVTHNLNADVVLALEDDWELSRELNIDPIIQALREDVFRCVRLGYVGYTQSLMARFVSFANMNWLEFSEFSSEPHVFTGHPRLETINFQKEVGVWPIGLGAGATEFEVAHRREARIKVGWPVDLVSPYGDAFVHVGTEHAEDPESALLKRVNA